MRVRSRLRRLWPAARPAFEAAALRAAALRAAALLAAAAAVLLVAASAQSDPVLTSQASPVGGGLVAHDIAIDFRDGLGRSGFIQITFSGNFDPSSSFALANWPDIQDVQTSSTAYSLQGGTGGGSSVDVVAVAQLVVPSGQGISYNAVVSRAGRNYVLVPEPSGAAAVSLLVVAALVAARRGSVRA